MFTILYHVYNLNNIHSSENNQVFFLLLVTVFPACKKKSAGHDLSMNLVEPETS